MYVVIPPSIYILKQRTSSLSSPPSNSKSPKQKLPPRWLGRRSGDRSKMELNGEIDRSEDFFRRAGSVPFQWEIKPGVPKHIFDADTGSPPPRPPQKLPPPPAMHAATSPSPTLLSRSISSSSAGGGGGGGGRFCFPSMSFSHRTEKRALKMFSLLRRLRRRRRSVSDRFVPRSSPSSPLTEEDELEVGSSGRSLTPSDASSF